MSNGLFIEYLKSGPLKGRELDRTAEAFGLKRKRYFIFFKEWDSTLRKRILVSLRDYRNCI